MGQEEEEEDGGAMDGGGGTGVFVVSVTLGEGGGGGGQLRMSLVFAKSFSSGTARKWCCIISGVVSSLGWGCVTRLNTKFGLDV